MRILSLLWLAPFITALFQTYNGPIDGNTCNGTSPTPVSVLPFQTLIGASIHQVAFQTVGDGYTYTGSVSIQGLTGTYNNKCCTANGCEAEAQSVNGGFSECGLTWCGQENQWVYIDFTSTGVAVPPSTTTNVQFTSPIDIATNDNGDPVFSVSYGPVSPTPSQTLTPSETESASPSRTPPPSLYPSETSSETQTPSLTRSLPPLSASSSRSGSPSPSPSGICYSVSRLYNTLTVLGSYYYILPGINVSQPYGSGFISMGNFVGCSVLGATCKCSYTQGSTVAGCGGRRNSYITYSYGATSGYSFVNESPTCSYNFLGTIYAPPSTSPTTSRSPSATRTQSLSVSASRLSTPSVSVTSLSLSIPSSSPTRSESPTLTGSPSVSVTLTVSGSPTRSESPSLTGSPSVLSTLSVSGSPTRSESPSITRSESLSVTSSVSAVPTRSESLSITPSLTESPTISPLATSRVTETPLVYCLPYPSSTPTADVTPTSTPLFLITPWPTNGSATPSTSPFFMMIPYPSSSPKPVNATFLNVPAEDIAGIAIGATAVGALTIGSGFLLLRSLNPPRRVTRQEQQEQSEEQELQLELELELQRQRQQQEQPGDEEVTYICVNSSELEEIKQLLVANRKRFMVNRTYSPHST